MGRHNLSLGFLIAGAGKCKRLQMHTLALGSEYRYNEDSGFLYRELRKWFGPSTCLLRPCTLTNRQQRSQPGFRVRVVADPHRAALDLMTKYLLGCLGSSGERVEIANIKEKSRDCQHQS